MLQLLSSPRPFLSPSAAFGVHEGSRPCTTRKDEARNPISQVTSAQHVVRSSGIVPSSTPSTADSSTKVAYDSYAIPHLTRTPWEVERHKRNSVWRRTKSEYQFPQHTFKKLPREVYDCVVAQLEQLHFAQDQPCPSCYLKDLFNLSLTSRAWDRAATLQMYRNVWVLGAEDHPKQPKLNISGTSRLKLLRRTLRERKALARCVRELHMPDFQILYHNASIEREEIVNLVASLVMACPNLERLVGFHVPYTHSFDRLSHALSTRPNLKERVWYLTDLTEMDEDEEDDPTQGYYHAACDPTERFLELNSNHSKLTSLVLHQEPARLSTELTFRSIIGALRQFPVLRHLSISGLPTTSFSNLALNALPANLLSVRLEDLPGINDKGLQRFASSQSAVSLESITLINLEIAQLPTLAAFLSPRITALKRFSLIQHKAPGLPSGLDLPDLQSPTLAFVHWELRSQAGPPPALVSPSPAADQSSFPFLNDEPISCLATSLLARSISRGLFPSLRTIRAPHDPQGVLQALCKPLATALLPSDAAFFTTPPRPAYSPPRPLSGDFDRSSIYSLKEFLSTTGPGMRADSAMSSPMSTHFGIPDTYPKSAFSRPLGAALTPARSRLAAQSRILAARKQPFVAVRVTDPKGALRVDKMINGFMGDVRSDIAYVLRPDRNRMGGDGGAEEGGDGGESEWFTGIGDVVGEWEVVGGRGYGSCRHLVGGRVGRNTVNVEDMF